MIKCPICGKLNEDGVKWCNNCSTWLVDKGIAVKPKRKRRLWLWLPLGVILGPSIGLLILSGLACSPDKGTLDSEPSTPASSQVTPSPSEQKRTKKISEYVELTNPLVRDTAVSAVQGSPSGIDANSEAWKIWQINYWVANNISYVSDPRGHDYFAYAHETLQTKAGDCDDFAILLASMYESVGLDAAIANIDTDDDWKTDHMTCIVYYPKDGDSFIDEEKTIMERTGLTKQVHIIYFNPANSKLLPEKYTTGIWIIADPTMAIVKDKVGYIIHKPYQATSVIDVGGE